MFAVMKKIPSALTTTETDVLREHAWRKCVVEVGSLFGYSTIVMAKEARKVISIDPHEGYPDKHAKPTYTRFLSNLKKNGIYNVIPILSRAESAIPFLQTGMADFVFIDAMGEQLSTYNLAMLAAMRLKPHVLAIHDYGHPEWSGVKHAVDDFARHMDVTPRVYDSLAVFEGLNRYK